MCLKALRDLLQIALDASHTWIVPSPWEIEILEVTVLFRMLRPLAGGCQPDHWRSIIFREWHADRQRDPHHDALGRMNLTAPPATVMTLATAIRTKRRYHSVPISVLQVWAFATHPTPARRATCLVHFRSPGGFRIKLILRRRTLSARQGIAVRGNKERDLR
jgi:hypothetical protein